MDSQNNQEQTNTQNSVPQSEPVQANTNSNSNTSTNSNSTQSNHTLLAAISYIGPLVIASYLMAKDNEFVKFHAKQGMVVFGIEVLVWILGSMMYGFWMITSLVNLATLILSIIGIVNVVQGEKKELPIVGGLAKNINI